MLEMIKGLRGSLAIFFLLIWLFPGGALAKEVGQFTQVEGKVDLYKQGKPEAIVVQPKTGAEEKDAVKTEALSRAQIQFLDASTMTVAPLSYVTIESYMYDEKKGRLGCLSELTRGLVHLIVSPLAKLEKKEFLVKTPTAILGIRGTELYLLIGPDFTDVYVKKGAVSAESRPAKAERRSEAGPAPNRAVEILRRQAEVRAANMDPPLLVYEMHGTRVFSDRILPPIVLTDAQFQILAGLMNTGVPPNLGSTSDPGDLLNKVSKLTPLGYMPPAPPAPPVGAPSFPGGGGGGGVVSPSI
jgi:hypothetical protein